MDANMPTYRLRSDKDLLIRAINMGLKPSGTGIGEAAGLPAGTVNALRNGRPPAASSMAALVRLFNCSAEDLFEIVDDDARIGA
jgi:Cro/C1-type helix-turn-helix DNA-binding protein